MEHSVRRIGVLAPPANVAVEREWPAYLPDGVAMNHNRLSRPSTNVARDDLLEMNQSIERAARDLAYARPDVIAYACTSGSFLEGRGLEGAVSRRINDLTGVAAFTTSEAVVAGLRILSARKVFMITPYPDAVNAEEIAFLEHYGFEVAGVEAFGCETSQAIRALSSQDVAELALRHRAQIAECDALFLSCTNLLTMNEIEKLEEHLGVPVLSSNQATLWMALSLIGADASKVPGRLGRFSGRGA